MLGTIEFSAIFQGGPRQYLTDFRQRSVEVGLVGVWLPWGEGHVRLGVDHIRLPAAAGEVLHHRGETAACRNGHGELGMNERQRRFCRCIGSSGLQ